MTEGPDTTADPADAAWAAAVAAPLRKAGRLAANAPDSAAIERLARITVEGVAVPVLGTAHTAAATSTTAALAAPPGTAPYLRGARPPGGGNGDPAWDVRSAISGADPAAANTLALAELAGGATSLWLRLDDTTLPPTGLPRALDGVHLDRTAVVLDHRGTSQGVYDAVAELTGLAERAGIRLHPGTSLGLDPVGRWLRTAWANRPEPSARPDWAPGALAQAVGPLARTATDNGIGALVVDGTALHRAGAGDVGEIGYSLAVGAAYLRALVATGLDVDTAAGLISFRYAVTDEQFTAIAKLRAARFAWARLTELAGATAAARAQRVHTVTSSAMLTRYDVHTNLLRTTVAAFAAAVGGADAITVAPFDAAAGDGSGLSRRMARNISHLLAGESHVGAVADPAGGAPAVEQLTATLAQLAWDEMQLIERTGGIVAALSDGSLAERVTAVRAERDRRIAVRTQPITGVSEFPDATEAPAPTGPDDGYRWAAPFETLRDDPPPHPILLVTLGTQAAASARVLFTENLLAAGGVRTLAVPDPASLADTMADSGATVVFLAGTDRDYADLLAPTVRAARAAGATAIFVAGRPGDLRTGPTAETVTATVAVGDDVLDFLTTVRTALGGTR